MAYCKEMLADEDPCHAQGITYSRSLSTGWKPPLKVRRQSAEQAQQLRDRFHIIVEGQHLLPPILDFKDMKFPAPVLRQLTAKNITRPTPIQMQVCAALCVPHHISQIAHNGKSVSLHAAFWIHAKSWCLLQQPCVCT